MPRLKTLNVMKKVLLPGVFVAVLTALVGLQTTAAAAQGQRTWSIVAHFRYLDGFEFDYVVQRGVSTADMPAFLAECGQSHWAGFVVYYHCYPVPE